MSAAPAFQAACVPPANVAPPARGGGSAPVASAPANDVQAVHAGVNRHRQSRGCAALVWSEGGARAAQRHSDDMARRRYFSHTSPEGSQAWDRMRAQGPSFSRAAENIAMNGGVALEVVRVVERGEDHSPRSTWSMPRAVMRMVSPWRPVVITKPWSSW